METINKWMATDEYKEAVEKWAQETLDSTRKEFATEADRMFKELLTYGRTQCSVPLKEEKIEEKDFIEENGTYTMAQIMEKWTAEEIQQAFDDIDKRWVKILKECIPHLQELQKLKYSSDRGHFINFIIGETYGKA